MGNIKRYLKEQSKSYLLYATLFILIHIIVISIFGPPIHYAVPILAMITGYGLVEIFNYKAWKKNKH
ncbi:hypothetical protein [Peribacillus butanolivorans]|uniref:hypothetical protein n=1 Tax=Peribacillus butanolivorans TaxID=421767 RepID=UPI0035E28F74